MTNVRTTGRRVAGITLAVLATAASLTACSSAPEEPLAKVIVHKEYIPASIQTRSECSGAVPVMCGDMKVVEKQCWRLDVEVRHPLETEYLRKEARERGEPNYWTSTETHCVFPSEFDKVTVGDPFTAPALQY